METQALHFRFNFHALRFHVITFVLTYSPECSLCVIITTAGEEEERVESIAFSSGGTKPKHRAAPCRRELCAVGTALLCHGDSPAPAIPSHGTLQPWGQAGGAQTDPIQQCRTGLRCGSVLFVCI